MKKLALVIVLLSGVVLTAQRHEGKQDRKLNLNPEQMATIQTKKMTLALDLNSSQQKEIKSVLLSNAELRQEKMAERKAQKKSEARPTEEEKFRMQSERLDHMIAHKAKMKNILTSEQFSKWEKMQRRKGKEEKRGSKSKVKK